MRITSRMRTEALFRSTEALRKRVEELELANAALQQALRTSNNDNVSLAKRLKYIEERLMRVFGFEIFIPPEG